MVTCEIVARARQVSVEGEAGSPIKHPEKVGSLDFLPLPSRYVTSTRRELQVWDNLGTRTTVTQSAWGDAWADYGSEAVRVGFHGRCGLARVF